MSLPDDPQFDLDAPEALLALNLLDLRAQYEEKLRLMTKLQRHLERYRSGRDDEMRRQAKIEMAYQLTDLRQANHYVNSLIDTSLTHVESLPNSPARSPA